jgi:hypothetical protein
MVQAFIEYLRMRGYEGNDFFGLEPIRPRLSKSNWTSVSEVKSVKNFLNFGALPGTLFIYFL